MANRRTFGRRAGLQRQPPPLRPRVAAAAQSAKVASGEVAAEGPALPFKAKEVSSLDRELLEWKRARKGSVKIPWRPLSLMASLCFGIASFVLPDSINDVVQWPLYALMIASFLVGVSARRRKPASHKIDIQPGTRGP